LQNVTELSAWIGKEQVRREVIDLRQARLLAVTLDTDVPQQGSLLPMPWHWAWFNDALPASELGRDGHPKRGGFLPPIALPRRMWAGGEFEMHHPIRIGREIEKRSTIDDIAEKTGSSGKLCIVSIRHDLFDGETLCVREKQNLVYREDPVPDAPVPVPPVPPQDAEISSKFTPDAVLMFRYSALTFNGHRIHYDVDYARDVEGYRGLVFHAPLTATKLYALANQLGGSQLSGFSYRATAPLFCGETIALCGKKAGSEVIVWAENADGHQAMIATAKVKTG